MGKTGILSVKELGEKLTEAGRLNLRPLCVYGTDELPEGAVPSYTVDRCVAKAVYTAALFKETPSLYIESAHEQCCGGGMVWMGLAEPHPKLKYFVTVGTPDFRGGAAEHLKATPELFDEQKDRAGKLLLLENTPSLHRVLMTLHLKLSGPLSCSQAASRSGTSAGWRSTTPTPSSER